MKPKNEGKNYFLSLSSKATITNNREGNEPRRSLQEGESREEKYQSCLNKSVNKRGESDRESDLGGNSTGVSMGGV